VFDDLNAHKKEFAKRGQVAVVGSGPAGLTLAKKLSEKGLGVILISSGTFLYDRKQQDLYSGKIVDDIPLVPLSASRLRMFGGTSNHWTGHCGPFDDIDFQSRDFIPDSGWPIDPAEFKKYYKDAQELLELGAYKYFHTPTEGPEIFPELGDFQSNYLIQNPFRFGPEWRDFFEKSESCYVLENANLTSVTMSDDGRSISTLGVRSIGGQTAKIDCDYVVLACGGIENARILLNSPVSARLPCLGHYYAFHPRVVGAQLHLAKPLTKNNVFQWHQVDGATKKQFIKYTSDFQITKEQPNYAMNLLNRYSKRSPEFLAALRLRNRVLGDSFEGDVSDDLLSVVGNLGGLISEYTNHKSLGAIDTLDLMTYVDPTPTFGNKITLNKDKDEMGVNRCTALWRPSDDDIKYTYEFNIKFAEMVGSSGLGRVKINPLLTDRATFTKLVQDSSGGGHQMGTTRISNSLASGVVDKNLKVHDVKNLFCAGSSVFPTYSWVNPTMTIVALSVRLADHISTLNELA
jgi:choline dehydrogenase-like flavoprotein